VGRGGDAQEAAARRLQVTDPLGGLRYRTGRPLRVFSRAAAFTLSGSGSGMAGAYADEHPVAAPVRMPRGPACALRYRLRSPCFGMRSEGCGGLGGFGVWGLDSRLGGRIKPSPTPEAPPFTTHHSRPTIHAPATEGSGRSSIIHPPSSRARFVQKAHFVRVPPHPSKPAVPTGFSTRHRHPPGHRQSSHIRHPVLI
jgi:hypothetical protein